jgi:Rps23 Pro-64 3,4-dihydroxylase Tpa1-like proline 4-hydroxylase
MIYKIIDNFLDPEDFKAIQQEVKEHDMELIPHGADVAYKLDTGDIYKSTRKYWSNKSEGRRFNTFFEYMIAEELPTKEFSLMVHHYMPGAEISWHKDYSSLGSYSFYLHDEWRSEWGGQLFITGAEDKHFNNGNVFEHRQDVMDPGTGVYIEPKPNRLVLIYNCFHKVNRVSHPRTSFTGFFK